MDDMLNLRRTETENWLLTEFYCNTLLAKGDKGPASESATGVLWPFLNPYYSPLNPIYTPVYQTLCAQGLRPLNEKQLPVWMLRDGAVPLTWFFSRHQPDSVEGQILVHADLQHLVPENWAEKVASYRHRTPANDIESLFMAGPVNERTTSIDELEEKLNSIEAVLGKKKMAAMSVRLYCPMRDPSDSYPARYMQKIYSAFKRVTALDWFDVENIGSLKNVGFVELNSGWLFKDSYVQHHVLSRGATLLVQKESSRKKRVQSVPLSRYHSVDIEPLTTRSAAVSEKDRRLEKFFIQNARLRDDEDAAWEPWPKWHERWCRAMLKQKKRS